MAAESGYDVCVWNFTADPIVVAKRSPAANTTAAAGGGGGGFNTTVAAPKRAVRTHKGVLAILERTQHRRWHCDTGHWAAADVIEITDEVIIHSFTFL